MPMLFDGVTSRSFVSCASVCRWVWVVFRVQHTHTHPYMVNSGPTEREKERGTEKGTEFQNYNKYTSVFNK